MTLESATLNAIDADIRILWDFNQMHHQLQRCSVGIGLGSHDPSVGTYAADLFNLDLFPTLVFTGANAPTTKDRFPRGEAIHYREMAIARGVPSDRILVEPRATNTEENFTFSRKLLQQHDIPVESVLVISRPYQERRAYATCKKVWPDIEVICASKPMAVADYFTSIGNPNLVTNMLVGDTQRVIEYPKRGLAIEQDVPADVIRAMNRLIGKGFTERLLAG